MSNNDCKVTSTNCVTIILLNWNGWRDTLDCISTLQKLEHPNYKILIIDNASSDNSVAQIRESHPDIPIIINSRNLGFGAGCNVGIRKALKDSSEYIWLLNNDTRVNPQSLSTLTQKIETDPSIAAVGSVIYYLDENLNNIQAWGGGYVSLWAGRARHCMLPANDSTLDYLTGASILLRSSALTEIGLFDELFFMYWEDADLCFRLRNAGWKLAVAANSFIWHKESASLGKQNPLLTVYFGQSLIYFFKKHAPQPFWPVLIGTSRQLMKYVYKGKFQLAYSILLKIVGPK